MDLLPARFVLAGIKFTVFAAKLPAPMVKKKLQINVSNLLKHAGVMQTPIGFSHPCIHPLNP